jgi:hypothetical protein
MLRLLVFFIIIFSVNVFGQTVNFADKPEHTILLVLDGIAPETWEKHDLPNLKKMISEGALVEKLYAPSAAHPRTGAYAEIHSCSIPNPVMMSGTVFITKETEYLQDVFFPNRPTAFVVNSTYYRSLSNNYQFVFQQDGRDTVAYEAAIKAFDSNRPALMRLHFQDPGGAGSLSLFTDQNPAWKYNIWADGSPYRQALSKADELLGRLVEYLRQKGVLEKTAFVILGDHGQHLNGWHPPEYEESAVTTMLVWGAGAKSGARLQYAELIDVAPTISNLINVKTPANSQGRVLGELLKNGTAPGNPPRQLMKELVQQLVKFRALMPKAFESARKLSGGKQAFAFVRVNGLVREQFYDENRFTEWKRFKTLTDLVEHNNTVLKQLEDLIAEFERNP